MERVPNRAPLARGVMLGLCIMGLVGCGGGGGGGNVRDEPPPSTPTAPSPPPEPEPPVTPPVDPPVTPPEPEPEPEPPREDVPPPVPSPAIDAHLAITGADKVRIRNQVDDDIRLLFVGAGLNADHPGLEYRVRNGFGITVNGEPPLLGDESGEGTRVALIAGGSPVGMWPGGVTNSARLMFAKMLPNQDDGSYRIPANGDFEAMAQHYVTQQADIVHVSTAMRWEEAAAGEALYRAFSTLANHGALIVTGSGDEGRSQPSQFARLPFGASDPDRLRDAWLVVGAVSSELPDRMHGWSNACGVAMNQCLVAPGDVEVPDPHDAARGTVVDHGTDYAAAQVAGAAALVLEKFPYFDGELLRQTLLASATDLGEPGVDAMYGWGLLNVEKAAGGLSRLDWGDVAFDIGGTDGGWAGELKNDISGDGGIWIHNSGTTPYLMVMSGHNTYRGLTRITGGFTLRVDGHIESDVEVGPLSHLTLADGASLGSDVTVGVDGGLHIGNDGYFVPFTGVPVRIEGSVRNAGNFSPSIDTPLSIGGDLVMEATSQMGVYLGAPAVQVDGRAALDGTLRVMGSTAAYVPDSDAQVLTADGGVTGTFSTVTWSSPTVDATVHYGADRVWIGFERVDLAGIASAMGLAPTSIASASRVESAFDRIDDGLAAGALAGTSDAIVAAGAIQNASATQFGRSIESLSGEIHDADGAFAMMAIDGNRRTLETRLDAVHDGQAAGPWSHRTDGLRGWSSFDMSARGWTLGFDQPGRDGMTIGASLAQTDGDAWHSQRFDRERNRQVDAQVYASWTLGEGGYLLGSAAFGHMQRWLQREVWLGDASYRVSSDYAHRYGALALQSGRRIPFGGSVITPYLGVQALQLAREGFSEEGASGFGLTSDDASMSALQALAGARWSHAWGTRSNRWTLGGRLEWQRLLSQSDASIQARFTGMDAWAPIVADGLDRDVGLFGLGLEAGFGARGTVRFDLDSRYGDGEQWTGAMATWITAF